MTGPGRLSEASGVTVGADGSVPVPAALRMRLGLEPGAAATLGLNEHGELVIRPGELPAERRERFQARLERSLGKEG